MGLWQIIIPEASANYVLNPSLESPGWFTEVSATAERVADGNALYGRAAMRVTYGGGSYTDLVAFDLTPLAERPHYASLYVKGTLPASFSVSLSGGEFLTLALIEQIGDWARYGIGFTGAQAAGATELRILGASACDFFLDALQVEPLEYATSYIDGDQPGCRWSGGQHASHAIRPQTARRGGRVVDLEAFGVRVLGAQGIGMPFATHRVLESGLRAGAFFAGRQVQPRTINLHLELAGGPQLRTGLHALRAGLGQVIKSDLTPADEPFVLRYTGAGTNQPLEIACVYDSGLEFEPDDGGSYEQTTLRVIAYDDPFWHGAGERAFPLAIQHSFPGAVGVMVRDEVEQNGAWAQLGALGGRVDAIARGPDGMLYAAGNLPNVGHIARWTGTEWQAVGGGTDAFVRDMLFAPDGTLYICGHFTTAGGATVNKLAQWDGSNWQPLGAGVAEDLETPIVLCLGPDGTLYAGGTFTTIGGVSSKGIAAWDGAAWNAIEGLRAIVNAIVAAPDGRIFAGGTFQQSDFEPDVVANFIAERDPASGAWRALSAEPNSWVYALAMGTDGSLYAGGTFTHTAGELAVNYIARWDGANWHPLGDGLPGRVERLAVDPQTGNVYVVGVVDSKPYTSLWNGSTWVVLDIDGLGPGLVSCLSIEPGRFWLGLNGSVAARASAVTAITNPGSRAALPTFIFERTGGGTAVVRFIRNNTTRQTIWLDYNLLVGEVLTVDLERGAVNSSRFGPRLTAVARAADMGLSLAPGENHLSVWVDTLDPMEVAAHVVFRPTYWAADDVAG